MDAICWALSRRSRPPGTPPLSFGHIPFAPGGWRITRRLSGHTGPVSELSSLTGGPFGTVLADPPTSTSPEPHRQVAPRAPPALPLRHHDVEGDRGAAGRGRHGAGIALLPLGARRALAEGLRVLEGWGFTYKTMLVWHKVRKDGGSDGRGVGFYFRNVTEPVLFGVRGRLRTGAPAARRRVDLFATESLSTAANPTSSTR